MELIVRTPKGAVVHVHAKSSDTIKSLKNLVYDKCNSYDTDDFSLVYSGQAMEDSRTLAEYNIRPETTILMVSSLSSMQLFDLNIYVLCSSIFHNCRQLRCLTA